MIRITAILITCAMSLSAYALSTNAVIKKIKRGDRNVLAKIGYQQMMQLHSYRGEHYYVPRKIGQRSLRSLFGCLKNNDKFVRYFCSLYLYQLKLTYIHKKVILRYIKKEQYVPARLAMQDLLVMIDEQRFAKARELNDFGFLAKVKFEEISELIEKGYPEEGDDFTMKEFKFLRGGLRNPDRRVREFALQMLGRTKGADDRVKKLLRKQRGKEKHKQTIKYIDISLKCIDNPSKCPDVQFNYYE